MLPCCRLGVTYVINAGGWRHGVTRIIRTKNRDRANRYRPGHLGAKYRYLVVHFGDERKTAAATKHHQSRRATRSSTEPPILDPITALVTTRYVLLCTLMCITIPVYNDQGGGLCQGSTLYITT